MFVWIGKSPLTVWTVLFSVSSFLCLVQCGETPDYQISGLKALYDANSGDNWFWNPPPDGIPWNFTNTSANPCMDDWQGVTCTANCSQFAACDITELSLARHGLTGSLPSEFSLLSKLKYFNFYRNTMIGPIPTSIGTMTELTNIIIYRNCMTGTIPLELGFLSKMVYFDLGFNNLNGTIPWLELPLVEVYYADTNKLTGTIPTQFGTLSYLTLFAVCVNSLTGSLPSEIGLISQLSVLNVHRNSFTGTIPRSYNDLHEMKILNMAFNFLSGPAEDMVVSDELYYFYMSDNLFTGSFPFTELCQSSELLGVLFGNNFVTGTVSPCISNWTNINTLEFSENFLEGTLPDVFSSLDNLDTLILASNYFKGELGDVLRTGLVTVDVSDNDFSGTLPFEIFDSNVLQTFVAVKNCFTGTLSSQMCNAISLNTLELSGLTAGRGCVGSATVMQIHVNFANPFFGSIPPCVWGMGNLTQFGLSGNAISSKLSDIPETSLLENVSLSNNRLFGTIPSGIQAHFKFRTLDLSFNHLMGNIEQMTNYTLAYNTNNSVPVNKSLNLNVHGNRLSGLIPASFATTTSAINILAGNTFDCPSRADLPRSDPYHSKYVCGSDELDYFTYGCFMGIVALSVLGLMAVYYIDIDVDVSARLSSVWSVIVDSSIVRLVLVFFNWTDMDSTGHAQLDSMAASLVRYRLCCMLLVAMLLCIALPAYVSLKYTGDYSTHEQQHGWLPTAAYLQYDGPAVVMFLLWLLLLAFVIGYDFYFVERVKGALKQRSVYKMGWRRFGFYTIVLLANSAIVLVVNGVYVYVVLSQSTTIQAVVSFLMICFKLTYNIVVVVPLLDLLGVKFITIMGFMVFNNNVAPILATMAVDLSCFESLFVPVRQLSATYTVSHCSLLFTGTTTTTGSGTDNVVCDLFDTVENTLLFDSPFVYSNQCSSALLSAYVPLYLVTYGIIGISVAASQFIIMLYFTDLGGPQPDVPAVESDGNGGRSWSAWRVQMLRFLKLHIHDCSRFTNKALCAMVLPLNTVEDLRAVGRQRIYHSRQLALNYSVVFTILVTFGFACPVLAVVLVVNIVASTLVLQVCMYQHYRQAQALGFVKVWTDVLVKETRDVHKIIYSSRAVIVLFSALFATLFIFDMTFYHDTSLLIYLVVLLLGGVFGLVRLARYGYKHYPHLRHARSRSFSGSNEPSKQIIELGAYGSSTSQSDHSLSKSKNKSTDPEAFVSVENPIRDGTSRTL